MRQAPGSQSLPGFVDHPVPIVLGPGRHRGFVQREGSWSFGPITSSWITSDWGFSIPRGYPGIIIHDQHNRRWSAFCRLVWKPLPIGNRAAREGYKQSHIRAIAAELDRRNIHFCYFILGNLGPPRT